VIVGAAGDQMRAALEQRRGESLGVPQHLGRVGGERRLERLAERDRADC